MTEDAAHVEQLDTQFDETESNRSHHSSLSSNSEDSLELETPENNSKEDSKVLNSVLKYKKVALGSRSHSEDSLELSHLIPEGKDLGVKGTTESQASDVNRSRERRSSGQSVDSLESDTNHPKESDKSIVSVDETVARAEKKVSEDAINELKSDSCPKSELESYQHREETRRLLSSYSESESFESSQLGSYDTDDLFVKDSNDNTNTNTGKNPISDHEVGLKDTICSEKEQKVTKGEIDKNCETEETVYAEIFGEGTESADETTNDSNDSVSEVKVKEKQDHYVKQKEQGHVFRFPESQDKQLTDKDKGPQDSRSDNNKEPDSSEFSCSSSVRPDTYGGCDSEEVKTLEIEKEAGKQPESQDSCVESEAGNKGIVEEVRGEDNSSRVDFEDEFEQFQQYEELKPDNQSLSESTVKDNNTSETEKVSDNINNKTISETEHYQETVEETLAESGSPSEKSDIENTLVEECFDSYQGGEEAEAEALEPEKSETEALESEKSETDVLKPEKSETEAQGPEKSETGAPESGKLETGDLKPKELEIKALEPKESEVEALEPKEAEPRNQEYTSESEKENQIKATDRACSYSYLKELANDEKGIYKETPVIHDLPEDQVSEENKVLEVDENTEQIKSSEIRSEIVGSENTCQIKDSVNSNTCQVEEKLEAANIACEKDKSVKITDTDKDTLSDTEEDIHAKENSCKRDSDLTFEQTGDYSIPETLDSDTPKDNNLLEKDSLKSNLHLETGGENTLNLNCSEIRRTSKEQLEVIFESECGEESSTDNQQKSCVENHSVEIERSQSVIESSDISKDYSLVLEESVKQEEQILEQRNSDRNSAPNCKEDIEAKLGGTEEIKDTSEQAETEIKEENSEEQLSTKQDFTTQPKVRESSVSVDQEKERAVSPSATESVDTELENTEENCSEILQEKQQSHETVREVVEKSELSSLNKEEKQSQKSKTPVKSRLPVKKAGKEHHKQVFTESPVQKVVTFTEENTDISIKSEDTHTVSTPNQNTESNSKEESVKGHTTGSEKDQHRSTGQRGRSLKKGHSVADPTPNPVPDSEKPAAKPKRKQLHQRSKSLDTNSWYKKHTAPLSQGLTFEEKFKFYWGQRTLNQTKPNPLQHQVKEVENQGLNQTKTNQAKEVENRGLNQTKTNQAKEVENRGLNQTKTNQAKGVENRGLNQTKTNQAKEVENRGLNQTKTNQAKEVENRGLNQTKTNQAKEVENRGLNQTKTNQAKGVENRGKGSETAAKMFAPPKKGTPEPRRARSASRDNGTTTQRKKWDLEDKKFESMDNSEFDRIEGTHSYAGNGSIYKTRNPRETSASQKRKESIKLAQMLAAEADRDPEDYRTPFQRKDDTIRELRQDLKEAHEELALKEDQLHEIVRQKDMKSAEIIEEKDQELFNLREQLHDINEKYLSLKTDYEETADKLEKAEKRFQDAKEYMAKKEAEHQEMYYQMYQKGIKTAEYERQEDLAQIAKNNPQEVAVSELAKKLAITQSQLERWQSLRREECYQEACKPETQADATLFFLRDSMFHYLTGNTKDDPERHLQAMIGIFGFTEVQMKKIRLAQDKKNKKKH